MLAPAAPWEEGRLGRASVEGQGMSFKLHLLSRPSLNYSPFPLPSPPPALQVMQCVDKDTEGHVHKHNLMYVRYVPLTKPGETDTEE